MRNTKAALLIAIAAITVTGCSSGNQDVKPAEKIPASTISQELAEKAKDVIESAAETVVEESGIAAEAGFGETTADDDFTEVEVQYNGVQYLGKQNTSTLNKVDTEVGYSFYSLRPMDHDRSLEEMDDIPTIQEILSGEYWTGDQVVHKHQASLLDEEPGYYIEDDCYIEETVNVQHYPQSGLSEGWVYEDGESFIDWITETTEDSVWGEDSRLIKYTYNVDGQEWLVYYGQRNLSEEPKECFSSVECTAFTEEEDGDFVVVTMKHDNFPTINTDDHVPSHDERLQTATESMEVIVSTIALQ